MALNLSTLTSSATSGDVLAEALTTADFLENVPVLRNLARGSQKGGDAKQDVALNQPKALPLIKNPAGDLGGYLYIPDASGNYAEGPSVTIGADETWEAEVDMVITQFGDYVVPMGGGVWTSGFGSLFYADGRVRVFSRGDVSSKSNYGVVPLNTPFNLKYGFNGSALYVELNSQSLVTVSTGSNQSASITHPLQLAQQNNLGHSGNYAIQKAKLTVNNAVVFDCDFNGSTSIRHGDTKFQASVGGPVTINQAGNDPATVIKKSVLRFDGADDFMDGLLNQTITDGYMFAAFSVLGDGGESYGHILDVTSTGQQSGGLGSFTFFRGPSSANNIRVKYNNNGSAIIHQDVFDSSLGDIMLEGKMQDGSQISKVNNANADNGTTTFSGVLNAEEFVIAADNFDGTNPALDLEFLAVFPASITDAQADDVRNYINNRNNVFDLKDGFGYYFYDATKAPVGAITTGSSSWNGRIVGSDFGDSDRYLTQATANDQPVSDGYVVTFADNSDHLDIPQVTQAGWQVVGTSLGTFAYRVNANAVTELNLLGNAGAVRSVGDLYGIILLPESATGKDIDEARKLLIDRGAADGVTVSNLYTYWFIRNDIVEFKHIDTSSVTSFRYAWKSCSNLESFPLIDTSNAITFEQAFYFNSSLSSFPAIQAPLCTNFSSAWQSCSALTSFPADAKLGTEANNVNFSEAWRSSGLTSFSTPLPSAGNCRFSWFGSNLTSFNLETLTATEFRSTWRETNLSSFSTTLPNSISFNGCWIDCSSLTDFGAGVFSAWNPSSIADTVFHNTWQGCTSLTAQSVENILTSIDASGQYATTTGASGGSALADAGIDIDYNVATGSLSAATNTAVTSLKSKGWSIIVNDVTL